MSCYLAIDLGASSGRAILGTVDNERVTLEEVHRFENGAVNVNGVLHWNLLGLFKEIKTGIRKALEKDVKLAGIAVDTWGVDFTLIDKDGQFTGFPYNYRDSLTADVFDWVFEEVPQADFYEQTGIQFMNINTIFQLACRRRNDNAELRIADRMLLMPNALTYLLCGDVSAEYTIATTTQAYNPRTNNWAWDLIDRLGLPKRLFPEIKQPCTVAGTLLPHICDELNCPPIPVVLVGSHDTACAVASVPAEASEGNWAFLSSGTWSLFGVELNEPIISDAARQANFTNEGGVDRKIRFLKNIMGLWLIQECRATWNRAGNNYSFDELERMASEAQPFKAFIDCNDERFIAPGNMPERIQEFCRETGQPVPEKPGEIVRCAEESLALRYRQSIEQLETITGNAITRLHLVGGGSQDKLLNQCTANAINRPVIVGPVEATAVGNVLSQAMAMGEIESLQELRDYVRRSFETQTYQPEKTDEWHSAYDRFRKLG